MSSKEKTMRVSRLQDWITTNYPHIWIEFATEMMKNREQETKK